MKIVDPPNDLEGVCAIPGRPDEVLAVESSYYGEKRDGADQQGGRIWHLRLELEKDGCHQWRAVPQNVIKLPEGLDEVEGILCLPGATLNEPILVLGEREDTVNPSDGPKLHWGRLNLENPPAKFEPNSADNPPVSLVLPDDLGWSDPSTVRRCGDLLLDGDGRTILSVAIEEVSNDGPFRSLIYTAAEFDEKKKPIISAPRSQRVVARIDGLKVEALGPGVVVLMQKKDGKDVVKDVPIECKYTVATDDENYGGVWRPVLPVPETGPATSPATAPVSKPTTEATH